MDEKSIQLIDERLARIVPVFFVAGWLTVFGLSICGFKNVEKEGWFLIYFTSALAYLIPWYTVSVYKKDNGIKQTVHIVSILLTFWWLTFTASETNCYTSGVRPEGWAIILVVSAIAYASPWCISKIITFFKPWVVAILFRESMVIRSKGVKRLVHIISVLSVVGWLTFISYQTKSFLGVNSSEDWIFLLFFLVIIYLIPWLITKVIYLVVDGFINDKEQ